MTHESAFKQFYLVEIICCFTKCTDICLIEKFSVTGTLAPVQPLTRVRCRGPFKKSSYSNVAQHTHASHGKNRQSGKDCIELKRCTLKKMFHY